MLVFSEALRTGYSMALTELVQAYCCHAFGLGHRCEQGQSQQANESGSGAA